MRYGRDDVLYTVFPLFHINAKYTSVMAALEADARLVMEERFSASRFFDTCREKGVTAFNYQGALLLMLFKAAPREDDADNPVRVGFGRPCPADLWEPFEQRFGVRLVDVYGMTEIAIATANSLDERKIGTGGRAAEGYEVRIVDADDRPVATGHARRDRRSADEARHPDQRVLQAGAGDARGVPQPLVSHRRPRAPGRRRLPDFIDRMKDAIRRRGENISSWEVEQVVNAHPAVLECAAYGVRSELSRGGGRDRDRAPARPRVPPAGAARALRRADGALRRPALRARARRAPAHAQPTAAEVQAARRRGDARRMGRGGARFQRPPRLILPTKHPLHLPTDRLIYRQACSTHGSVDGRETRRRRRHRGKVACEDHRGRARGAARRRCRGVRRGQPLGGRTARAARRAIRRRA